MEKTKGLKRFLSSFSLIRDSSTVPEEKPLHCVVIKLISQMRLKLLVPGCPLVCMALLICYNTTCVSPVILSKTRPDLQQQTVICFASAGSRLRMHIPAPDQSYTTTALYMVRNHSFSVCHLLFPAQCPSDKFYYLQTSLSQFLSRVNKMKLTTNTPSSLHVHKI